MKNIANNIKQKLASYIYIYIYIYRAAHSRLNSFGSYSLKTHIKFYRNLRVVGISASVTLAAFMTLAAFPITLKGNVAEAAPGTATASTTALAMSLDHASAALNIVPNDNDGTFAASADSEEASFNITTNNYTGYILSIEGNDDIGQLTNSAINSAKLDSIPSSVTEYVFSKSTFLNSKWGYRPSKYNSTTNTSFLPAPTTDASTLDVTNTANYEANNYTIALGARVDYSNPIGVYTGTFRLTVVANPVDYTIIYDKGNTADDVSGIPATQSSSTSETSITLSDAIPARTNYSFLGWCYGAVTSTDDADICSGDVYNTNGSGENLTFGIDQTTENIVTLHAMWKVSGMQNWVSCSRLSPGDTVRLTDSRDGQEYDIVKIGDYCVMKENLAITGTIPAEGSNFTGADITPDYTDYSKFSSTYIGNKVVQADETYGAYYNYCLASAGTVCSNVQEDATQDICPTNWKMPSKAIWDAIKGTSGSASLFAAQLGGYRTTSSSASGTSYGYYWSSTAYNANYPYSFRANATQSNLNTAGYNARYYGQTIRCVYSPYYKIKISAGEGIESVSVNDGPSSDLAIYTGRMEDVIQITANPSIGYGPTYTWTVDAGSITGSTDSNTNSYTVGMSDASINVSAAHGVGVIIKPDAGTTVSLNDVSCTTTSGCVITGLVPGITYDLIATVKTGYTFSSWSTTAGNIASVSDTVTTFTVPSASSGIVAEIISSAPINTYKITFKTSNAQRIVLDGTEYSNGSTATITYGEHKMYGKYASRYTFSKWTATGGSFADDKMQLATYIVTEPATITLTGQSVTNTIQDITLSTCTTAPMPVYDTRDNEVYWIAKLADNRCWMLDNLRLGKTSSMSLTSSDTNTTTSRTLQAGISINSEYPAQSTDNKRPFIGYKDMVVVNYGYGSGKVGVQYNMCTASLGYMCDTSSTHDVSISKNRDVCPKGWRIPVTESTNEYTTLFSAYSNNVANFLKAFSATLSGDFEYGPNGGYQGSSGNFWGGFKYSYSHMRGLSVKPWSVTTDANQTMYYSQAVRCILK